MTSKAHVQETPGRGQGLLLAVGLGLFACGSPLIAEETTITVHPENTGAAPTRP